jgi:Putative F0F1-ATPase subunit Ca2+/Mg2+ transporter
LEVGERRELYSGFGDSLVLAFEFAATPFLFGLIGHFVDRRVGTTPWLTIALVVFALAGLTVRMYYGYVAAMEEHERSAPWKRLPPPQSPVGTPEGVLAGRPVVDQNHSRNGTENHGRIGPPSHGPLAGA